MPYAILRFEKHTGRGTLAAAASHMTRARPTPNADPSRTPRNRVLVGSDNPVADVDRRAAGAVTRKNSVIAVEVLLTASPEWWAEAVKPDKAEWVRRSQAWLEQTFGKENLVHLQLHVDETTPHLTGFIVPRTEDGKLAASRWLDGGAKLAAMQTGYAEAVASLGLQRGIEGSQAKHTRVSTWYGQQQRPVPVPPAPAVVAPPVMLKAATREDWAERESSRIARSQRGAHATLRAKAQAAELAERKMREYQATAEAMRADAQRARDVPLQGVAQHLGLERDRHDRAKWVDGERRFAITVTGQRWFDHKAEKGGGGAIDLVRHVLACDFKQALAWLGFGLGEKAAQRSYAAHAVAAAQEAVQAAMREAQPFTLPAANTRLTARVARYLTVTRGLDPDRIRALLDTGAVRADARGNAVFAMRDAAGAVRGAELRGTGDRPWRGLAPGSTREAVFAVGSAKPRTVALCESAIDALSWHELRGGPDALAVSTAGARGALPAAVLELVRQAGRVVVAFDADPVGEKAAAALIDAVREAAPGVEVVRQVPPDGAKDWNDALRLHNSPAEAPGAARTAPKRGRAVSDSPEPPRAAPEPP